MPDGQDTRDKSALAVDLDEFGWEALEQECARLGVSEEELVRFAIAYYLADLDSGRIARRVPPGSVPGA